VPTPTVTATPTPTQTVGPYTPLSIPGRIEVEDYDLGGEGIAYHDTTAGNSGGTYRTDDVDIEFTASEGNHNVGWIRDGEWLTYTADVTGSGPFTVTSRMASPNTGRQARLAVDGVMAATIAVPNTGSFGSFADVTVPVELTAGTHTLRLTFSGDGQNVNWLEFAAGSTPPTPTPTPTPTPEPADQYHFVLKWGTRGDGDGQFYAPYGIAADDPGNVYVVDTENYRVQKFSSDGEFVTKWGSYGSGDGQFAPGGVAVDGAGNVYVVDGLNYRVQKFSSDGEFVTKWGTEGTGDGQLFKPSAIAVDGAGNIYVTDRTLHRVQKFSSTGTFITKWGSYGTGDGQFSGAGPTSIAVDGDGNVYVTDSGNQQVQKFTAYHCRERPSRLSLE
jgi:hypothetical protein